MKYLHKVQDKQLARLANKVALTTPFYREKYRKFSLDPFTVETFENLPLVSSKEYHQVTDPDDLYSDQQESNYVFIKDGTQKITGASFWNAGYLDKQIEILVSGFEQLGLSRQDRVMNLLVPGISGYFHVFNMVLERTGTTIVPLGGESELPVIARFADDLQVSVLIGEPEFLVSVLDYLASTKPELTIETVFIVGRNPTRRQHGLMKKYSLNVYYPFYFSFETGIIGTQCSQAPIGTFHLSGTVYAELVDAETGRITDGKKGELVITSLLDRASPCIRYRSGNLVTFLGKKCDCGNTTPLFRLENGHQAMTGMVTGEKNAATNGQAAT